MKKDTPKLIKAILTIGYDPVIPYSMLLRFFIY